MVLFKGFYFYNIQGFQEFPDKYIMVAADNADLISANVEYMCSIKKVIFSRPGRSVGDLEHLGVHNGFIAHRR